jgi:modification methylase
MWDGAFSAQDGACARALEAGEGWKAFEAMHRVLDPVWREVHRVLVPGGIACIDIGDAVRTVGDEFALYPNHARILSRLVEIGLQPLPGIIWRKPTNAPNKFMGSGMLPPGAYVTLEHEHVLVVRKGGKRRLATPAEKENRRASAFFWEERNQWFSDVWTDLLGTSQGLGGGTARARSGAYPFELPYRLIHMFSVRGDTVLDPFLGTGTTTAAAMAAGRGSIGFEIDPGLAPEIEAQIGLAPRLARARLEERLGAHRAFVRERLEKAGRLGHANAPHGFPVMTRQETGMVLEDLVQVRRSGPGVYEALYEKTTLGAERDIWVAAGEGGPIP